MRTVLAFFLFSCPTRLRVGHVTLQREEKWAFAKLALWLAFAIISGAPQDLASRGAQRRVFAAGPRRVKAVKHSWGGTDRPVHLIVGSTKFRQVTAEIGFAPVVLGRRGHLNRHS